MASNRQEVASLDCNSPSVGDVVYVLQQLESMAPKGSVVYVEMQMAAESVYAATLWEETLTDGSKAYSIQLR